MDINDIKEMAREVGVPVTQMIALSPGNDPFYTGTPGDWSLGRWFHGLWQQFGYSAGVHIRRMHYQIVSQNPPVCFPDGKPYENTMTCWSRLNIASKIARYLGLVEISAFIDRRNEPPIDHQDYYRENNGRLDVTWLSSSLDIPMPDVPAIPKYDLYGDSPQRYHLEVFCEKSTMNDILDPLLAQYNGVLVVGKGELSITFAHEALERYKKINRPVRIFYISDFDPAGASMPVAMARKLEYQIYQEGLYLDIRLFPIALTHAQTKQYTRLLPTPLKDTERRKAGFEERYGEGGIELDALEALYPGELERLVRSELDRYYDHTIGDRVSQAGQKIFRQIRPIQQGVYDRHKEEISFINDEWNGIEASIKAMVEAHMEKRLEVWQDVRRDLVDAMPDVGKDDIPLPHLADERSGALYDSARSYRVQNDVYQAHKANMSNSADL